MDGLTLFNSILVVPSFLSFWGFSSFETSLRQPTWVGGNGSQDEGWGRGHYRTQACRVREESLTAAVEWQMGLVGSYRGGVLCFPGSVDSGLLASLPQDRPK